jgi:hypothetical protein
MLRAVRMGRSYAKNSAQNVRITLCHSASGEGTLPTEFNKDSMRQHWNTFCLYSNDNYNSQSIAALRRIFTYLVGG